MLSISSTNHLTYRSLSPTGTAGRASDASRVEGSQQPSISSPLETNGFHATTSGGKGSPARQALDAGYKALGETPSLTTTGDEWYEVVGLNRLSREELFDVIHNKSGEFSELEVQVAKENIVDRQSAAMKAANPTVNDHAAAFRAAVDFLDAAGPNEMKTLSWAKERAAAQIGYEWAMEGDGQTPENLDSGNSIVRFLLNGYEELRRTGSKDSDVSNMPSYQEGIRHWHARQSVSSYYTP